MTAAPRAGRVAELQRLRIRLAALLGGIEDLKQEWDNTVELVRHLRTPRAAMASR